MKRLINVIMGVAAVCVAANMMSCGDGDSSHAKQILIPDTANMGKVVPVIQGAASQAFAVSIEQYTLNMADSLPTLALNIMHNKALPASELSKPKIGNDTSALSVLPYIQLTDSIGAPIDGFWLVASQADVDTLNMVLGSSDPSVHHMVFTGNRALTPAERDSLALIVKNFVVVADIQHDVDKSKIDGLLSKLASAYAGLQSARNDFNGATFSVWGRQEALRNINRYYDAAKSYVAQLKPLADSGALTPEQMAKYRKYSSF